MAKSYKQQSPHDFYPNIIIGSGMSGASLAAILSRQGEQCLVLERHYEPGGFTHTFKRRDYEWDVGVHYVGQAHIKGSMVDRLLGYVSDGSLQWAQMDDTYDRIIIGDKSFEFKTGREEFVNELKRKFPNPKDQKAIDDYMALVKKAVRTSRNLFMARALPPWLRKIFGGFLTRKAKFYTRQTTQQALDQITDNKLLQSVLTGQFGDYGLAPPESSFLMHCMLASHYFKGGSYPVGGSSSIFKSIEPIIEQSHGEVYTNAEVDSIVVEKNKAVGVKMADGKVIKAKRIISSAGIHLTYNKLLRDVSIARKAGDKLRKLAPSVGHVCLYIGIQEPQETLNLPKTNFWVYPQKPDHGANIEAYLADPEHADFPLVYISFPSAKDPEFTTKYPGRSTIEVLTLGEFEWFEPWQDKPWKKRGRDYEALKERILKRLLDVLYKHVPQVIDKIDYYELSTPLSTRNFVNYSKGEVYGLAHDTKRFSSDDISVYTPVKNLFLTGQDIISAGVAGALSSAMTTAAVIKGRGIIKKIFNDQTKS